MRKFLISAAFCLSVMAPANVAAQGVPTIDTQNIAQNIKQLQNMLQDLGIQNEQLDQLLAQVDLLEDQLKKFEELYSSLTGARDIIGLAMDGDINSLLDGNLTDVVGTIQGIANGDFSGLTSGKSVNMRKTMDQALASAGLDSAKVQEMGSSPVPGAKRVSTQASSGAMMAAIGEQAHKESGDSLQRVEKLVGMIPEMEDTKASIDLNTRVTAELAISIAKMIELESVTAVNAGMGGVLNAAAVAEDRAFMTFSAP